MCIHSCDNVYIPFDPDATKKQILSLEKTLVRFLDPRGKAIEEVCDLDFLYSVTDVITFMKGLLCERKDVTPEELKRMNDIKQNRTK